MDTGADIADVRDRMLFANAYLGARPIAEALAQGADIVITGRVADAALSSARWCTNWLALGRLGSSGARPDRRASARMLGPGQRRQLRLGRRVGQGPDLAHLGYPIAEVREDGSAVITKAPGTGGRVSFDTLRQQLLYEVHDPHAYFSPDVVLDMGTIRSTTRATTGARSGRDRPAAPER